MRGMAQATANGIQIEYDTFGDRSARPLLLVMGLGAQMIAWDPDFCRLLADRGHFVVRFDNRDVGLSTKFEAAGVPDVAGAMAASAAGKKVEAAYTLADMADDAFGLLDALGIEAAHIVGASMGGMIVQQMAIQRPQRVLSLTSIMSSTGNPALPPAKPEAMARLTMPAPQEREAAIEYRLATSKIIGSVPDVIDEERLRRLAAEAYDRSFYPVGMARQLVGIVASGPRHEQLREVRVPTLVVHGAIDPLVPVEGGKDTAACIPGAELLIIDGMGHDLPAAYWPQIVDAISALTAAAGAAGK